MNSKIFEKHEATLIGLLDQVNDKISQEKFQNALTDLQNCEEIIELHPKTQDFIILNVMHSFSLCYQKMRNANMTADYLIKSLSLLSKMQETDSPAQATYIKRHEVLKTLHLCAVLSSDKNHTQALKFSKKALKDSYSIFESISSTIEKQSKKPRSKKTNENIECPLKTKRIVDRVLSSAPSNSLLPLSQDWVQTYSISNILLIQPFQLSEFTKPVSAKTISSLAFVSKSVFLLIASHLLNSTETRIHELASKDPVKSKDLFQKTFNLCKTFFPASSPFYQYIQNSFKKQFRPVKKDEKKSIVPTVRRIYTKRNSEKPRNTSEKSVPKVSNYKVTPPRKLTPSTRLGCRVNVSKVKKVLKDVRDLKDLKDFKDFKDFKDPSSRDNFKYSSAEMSKSSTMFRDSSEIRVKRQTTNVSDSGSFDGMRYLVQEFKNNFVMTSNLLYGDLQSSEDEEVTCLASSREFN